MKKILIVGGGSAGWMSAATMIRKFPNSEVTVIESPNISTVGVGESTIGGIRLWTNWLGIDDKEFLKFTDGSYKLAIKFTDFYKKDDGGFYYPFGAPDVQGNHAGLNDWWIKKFHYPETHVSDYATCMYPQMAYVNENKCDYNTDRAINFKFKRDTAFHFDATKFAFWLRDNYCIPRGVKHILEDVHTVNTSPDGIVSINDKHSADLYIDCTGFKSLLLAETLDVPFDSYEDMLPNNKAWATKIPYTDKEKQLDTFTNCTAIENGWVWNIPLWSRIGTGYVYSDKFVNDDVALEEFKRHLESNGVNTDNLEYRNISMRVGIHRRLWVKNVVAIGLSAGFIEPLESNGLYTVHEFLIRLVKNLNREKVSQWDRDTFNYDCRLLFRNFAEFVAMHYSLSHRDDTEYWKANLNKHWCDDEAINFKADMKNGFGRAMYDRTQQNYFPESGGFGCIAAGMNWSPIDKDETEYMNSHMDDQEQINADHGETIVIDRLNRKRDNWKTAVADKPSLYQFLKENIYNADV